MISRNRGVDLGPFRRIESALSNDVLHRLRMLAKLRLLPAMYGSDIKKWVKQV